MYGSKFVIYFIQGIRIIPVVVFENKTVWLKLCYTLSLMYKRLLTYGIALLCDNLNITYVLVMLHTKVELDML